MTRRLLLLAVLVIATLAGCGLSADGEPQAIAPENLPPDLLDPNPGTSTTLVGSGGTASVDVYFIEQSSDGERLAAVKRDVAVSSDPGDRVTALLAQPTEEEAQAGFTNTIPPDTTLSRAPVLNEAASELAIDLSREFLSIEGPELAKAFAQIVWTVTELDGVRNVRFLVDGVEIRAQDAEGAEKEGAVTRADYSALAPAAG